MEEEARQRAATGLVAGVAPDFLDARVATTGGAIIFVPKRILFVIILMIALGEPEWAAIQHGRHNPFCKNFFCASD